ncbi:MAG TPA: hypothetical protein PLG85_06680, partial [Cyclobacteriaceae bacterium]|nr:hypothetical protein [Cyclobacteriaceae bacterium]
LETQLIVAGDLGYITEQEVMDVSARITRCKKLLNGFINYFQRQSNNEQPTTINEILEEYGSSSQD